MRILYVNAGNAGSLGLDTFLCAPPLALMYLTPTVPEHKKLLIDLKANPNIPESTIRHLIQRYDLVAISSYTPSIKNAMWVASMAKEYNKPVIISEIGYDSLDGTARDYFGTYRNYRYNKLGVIDLQEQSDCYQAALEVLWGKPWLKGIFWWQWSALSQQWTETPQGKPAAEILKRFYLSQ